MDISARHFLRQTPSDMSLLLMALTFLGLTPLLGTTAIFDTKQPVLQPIIPRVFGLEINFADCGGESSELCGTQCGLTIPANVDLRARLAWTDAFDADAD